MGLPDPAVGVGADADVDVGVDVSVGVDTSDVEVAGAGAAPLKVVKCSSVMFSLLPYTLMAQAPSTSMSPTRATSAYRMVLPMPGMLPSFARHGLFCSHYTTLVWFTFPSSLIWWLREGSISPPGIRHALCVSGGEKGVSQRNLR